MLLGLPSCLSFVNHTTISHLHKLGISPASSHSWACISRSINITTALSPLLLSPFQSFALTLVLVSCNAIISGKILQYYHLSAFILALSNSFSSCYFCDSSEIRNSTMAPFSLTFNGYSVFTKRVATQPSNSTPSYISKRNENIST